MFDFEFILILLFTIANFIVMVSGLQLLKEGLNLIFGDERDEPAGVILFVAGCLAIYCVASVAGMSYGVLSLGAMINDFDMKNKVKQLLKEGKIYDYSLREATDDAHAMANEYHCRAFVIDIDGTGDFDVVLTAPEDDTLIMRVVWPYKWVEDSKTS